MNPLPFSLDPKEVREPITRAGWYVLGRHPDGDWMVLHCRVRYEHILGAWSNSGNFTGERLLVMRTGGSPPIVVARSAP